MELHWVKQLKYCVRLLLRSLVDGGGADDGLLFGLGEGSKIGLSFVPTRNDAVELEVELGKTTGILGRTSAWCTYRR
jgi:hypothetical protein